MNKLILAKIIILAGDRVSSWESFVLAAIQNGIHVLSASFVSECIQFILDT